MAGERCSLFHLEVMEDNDMTEELIEEGRC